MATQQLETFMPRNLSELVALADKIALDTATLKKTALAEYLVQSFGWLGCDLAKTCAKVAKDLRGLTDKLTIIDRCLDGMESVYLLAKASKIVRCEVFTRAAGGEVMTVENINELIAWHKEQAKTDREVKKEDRELLLHQGILTVGTDNVHLEATISQKLGALLQEWVADGYTINDAIAVLTEQQRSPENPETSALNKVNQHIPDAEEILSYDTWAEFAYAIGWDIDGPVSIPATSKQFSLVLSGIEDEAVSKKVKVRLEELLRIAYDQDDDAFLQSVWAPKTLLAKLFDFKKKGVSQARAIELVQHACGFKDDLFREAVVDRCPDWIKPYLQNPVRLYMSNLADLAEVGTQVRIHFKGQDASTIRTIEAIDAERQRFTIDTGEGKPVNFTAYHLSFANELK